MGMATARVATTILRLLPVFAYSSGDPCGRHAHPRSPCLISSPCSPAVLVFLQTLQQICHVLSSHTTLLVRSHFKQKRRGCNNLIRMQGKMASMLLSIIGMPLLFWLIYASR